MSAEKKKRRNTRASPVAASPKDDYSSDELVIDFPCASNTRSKQLPQHPQSIVTRSARPVTPKKSPEKRQPTTRKKRRRPRSSSSSSDVEDQTLEETIQRVAASNNMTQDSVKKILKKLVLNEHILATVKLKEEDEVREESMRPSKDGAEGDDEDESNSLQPKLTRLKAKQLNKQLLPIVPLKAVPIVDEEVAALIREDLGSDDDDEEYKPTEEDIQSDDDPSTTISDIDSQPRTPATPAAAGGPEAECDLDQQPTYSRDGLFKIPKTRNDSHCSQTEQEQENIARRTRSKLCLQTTAIETIESTFVPPDITTDMYDFDCDMDHVWKDFLNEFTKPLQNNAEDDDDTDPEYVAADRVPVDPEEHREVKVSKKELNELVSELLEMSGIIDESYLDESLSNSTLIADNTIDAQSQEHLTPVLEETGETSELSTPQPRAPSPEQEQEPSPDVQVNITTFQPDTVSTPTAPSIGNQILYIIAPDPQLQPSTVVAQPSASQSPSSIISMASISQPSTSATVTNHSVIGNFFVQVSTPDESSYRRYYVPSGKVPVIPIDQRVPVEPSERRYRFVHNLLPVTVTYAEGQTGLTNFQQQLFQQQLRMHVQFAAQNFMQTYAHPKFWKMASTFKDMLLDLQEQSRTIPAAKAWNLDGAVECCTSWEKELDEQSDENTGFINFLLEEVNKSEKAKEESKYYQGGFHPKIMEWIITKSTFMYPKLLPYTPFRMDLRSEKRFIKSEERLIAYGMEMFNTIAKEEAIRNKAPRESSPTLLQIGNYISKYLCPLHTGPQIKSFINARQQRFKGSCASPSNPIKYYYKYSKAPPFQHVLEAVDLNNVIPPASYQKGELPHLWDKYLYSRERLAIINDRQSEKSAIESPESAPSTQSPIESHESAEAYSLQHSSTPNPETNVNITISLVLDPQQAPIPLEALDHPSISANLAPTSFQIVSPRKIDQLLQGKSYAPAVEQENNNLTEAIEPISSPYKPEIKEETPISIDDSNFDGGSLPETDPPSIETTEKGGCCECKCHRNDSQREDNSRQSNLEKGQKLLTDFFRSSPKKISLNDNRKKSLKQKLWEIYQRFRTSYVHGIDRDRLNWLLRKVFDHFCLIEGFSCFLDELKKMSSGSNGMKKMDVTMAKNEPPTSNGSRTRLQRVTEAENKDANYAYNFFEKVEETLLSGSRHAQYESFLEILQSFNPAEDQATDLYYKIENLLLADHPELVDLFLTFLLPGQAAEVGKFFEHFILTNANDFLTKLNIYFAKQPAQIRKIYSSLSDLSSESDVTMEQIKSRILPLLKGNPLLIEWFLQLFPPHKPPAGSVADCEVISVKKLPLPDYTDPNEIYEDVPFVEVAPESVSESTVCGTKYIQGRIVYGTQPARLSFLAHDCAVSAASGRDRSALNGCVHNVRPRMGAEGEPLGEKDHQPDMVSPEELHREEPRYKLCDDVTFNAHAIRLNPLVHGGKGITYADVAHLLVPDPNAHDESNFHSEDDRSNSPKKQQIKTLPKKRINSPINKKISTGKGSSPTATKKAPVSVPPDSKVIAASKKLKSMIETSPDQHPEPSTSALKRVAPPATAVLPPKKEKHLKKSASDESPDDERNEPNESRENTGQTSWTRDEDKVILEEIKNGYSAVEELVERIGEKINGRHASEIRLRYEFLMEVLKKFQKSV